MKSGEQIVQLVLVIGLMLLFMAVVNVNKALQRQGI